MQAERQTEDQALEAKQEKVYKAFYWRRLFSAAVALFMGVGAGLNGWRQQQEGEFARDQLAFALDLDEAHQQVVALLNKDTKVGVERSVDSREYVEAALENMRSAATYTTELEKFGQAESVEAYFTEITTFHDLMSAGLIIYPAGVRRYDFSESLSDSQQEQYELLRQAYEILTNAFVAQDTGDASFVFDPELIDPTQQARLEEILSKDFSELQDAAQKKVATNQDRIVLFYSELFTDYPEITDIYNRITAIEEQFSELQQFKTKFGISESQLSPTLRTTYQMLSTQVRRLDQMNLLAPDSSFEALNAWLQDSGRMTFLEYDQPQTDRPVEVADQVLSPAWTSHVFSALDAQELDTITRELRLLIPQAASQETKAFAASLAALAVALGNVILWLRRRNFPNLNRHERRVEAKKTRQLLVAAKGLIRAWESEVDTLSPEQRIKFEQTKKMVEEIEANPDSPAKKFVKSPAWRRYL